MLPEFDGPYWMRNLFHGAEVWRKVQVFTQPSHPRLRFVRDGDAFLSEDTLRDCPGLEFHDPFTPPHRAPEPRP